jgi:hypothetical protein
MLELGLSGYRRGRVGEKGLGLSQLGLSFARGGRARASRVRSSECKWGRARRFQRTSLARGLRGLGARCRCYAARPARAPACARAHGLAARRSCIRAYVLAADWLCSADHGRGSIR